MESQDRIRLLEANLARQLGWIAAAESKLAFIFGISVAMLGVLAALAPKTATAWTVGQAVFSSLTLVGEVAAIICLSLASFPRTDGPKGSLLFFGGIAKRSRDHFQKEVCALGDEGYVEDLCAQCHRNAEIADLKYMWVQRALLSLYLSVAGLPPDSWTPLTGGIAPARRSVSHVHDASVHT